MSARSTAWNAQSDRLSLVFAPGQRPTVDEIRHLLQAHPGDAADDQDVAVTVNDPVSVAGELQLRAAGMAFALVGLAPACAAPSPEIAYWYGFSIRPAMAGAEAIALYLAEGDDTATLPQLRAMTAVACRLAELAQAVVWQPARAALAPAAFIATIGSWRRGGPFPALGLTALYRDDAGAIRSEGLAFFTGQELRIEPHPGITTAQDAKIAARLINHLVGRVPINKSFQTLGPNGEQLSVEPPGSDGYLRVWRKS